MKIAICGGVDAEAQDANIAQDIEIFGEQLAKQIIRQNHTLVCGNLTRFDALVIEAACDEVGNDTACKKRVTSYRPLGKKAFTDRGTVFNSQLDDWGTIGKKLRYPEPIHKADVVVLVAGWDGTHTAANWARLTQTPILPVASFGEAAEEIYQRDRRQLSTWFGRKSDSEDFDLLNQAISGVDEAKAALLAEDIVSLAERMALSRDVFIVMSYSEDPDLINAAAAFQEVCGEFGFDGTRMDRKVEGDARDITDAIVDGIRDCAFAIVDLTNERPNVYYELGYARALGKPVILTAKYDAPVHFDAQGLERIKWKDFKNLRDQLRPRVETLATEFGVK